VTETDLTGPPAAAVATGRAGFRRLLVSLGIASGALSGLFGGIGGVLLPLQIEHIDRAHKVAALSLVAGVSAVFACVFNPVGGALSDRTRSRFGRRAPWLLGASTALLVVMAFISQASTIPLVLVAWCLVQAVTNLYQAPLTAVVPDRVSPQRRGAASAVVGVAMVLGGVAGIGIASQFTGHLAIGYLVLGGVVLLSAVYFVLSTLDESAASMPRPPRSQLSLAASLGQFLSALRHRDFAFVFASRAAAILGYYLVTGFELYILTNYIRLPHGLRPAEGVTIMAAIAASGALVAATVCGPLSDRLDRRKPFVFASSVLAGIGCVLPAISPSFTSSEIFAAFAGISFGCYLSVDQALVTLVLPRGENAARDLGVLNIANAGPQVFSPLLAGLIIGHLGGYRVLFVVGGCCGIAAAFAVMPVRAVR
jgi:MFS family permease